MKTFAVEIDKVVKETVYVQAETGHEAEDKAIEPENVLGCTGAQEVEEGLFIVRHYDGFDHNWIDVSEPLPKAEAQKVWNEKTNNGTKNTNFSNIDYYRVFPAETKMIFSGG